MKYSFNPDPALGEAARAQGSNLRCHYKQMSEVGRAVRGLTVAKAKKYLQDVIAKKDVIPYRIHTGGKGRHTLAKKHPHTNGSGFPKKASEKMLELLENLEKNAEHKEKEGKRFNNTATEELRLEHVQVLRAPLQRRRTYRAHGRIGPYARSPCHVQIIALGKKPAPVAKPKTEAKLTPKQKAIRTRLGNRVPEGGGLVKA